VSCRPGTLLERLPEPKRSEAVHQQSWKIAVIAVGVAVAACAGAGATPTLDARAPAGAACTAPAVDAQGLPAGQAVRLAVVSDAADRGELDAWCRGVGAPVVAGPSPAPVRLDSVVVVTWNIHVGAARVDAFVTDLRSGALTGEPTQHFVLLLQEARRMGLGVPELPARGRAARRLGAREPGPEADIVATARRLGLHLFYVPSMRNGGRHDAAEDRGNAILTTLPLTELTAIELPLLVQRRVAVAATIPLVDGAGRDRALRVSSVHLDVRARLSRPLAPFGAGRMLQASALADALAGDSTIVVGGDFNSWSLQRLEGGLALMQAGFPDLPEGRGLPTFYTVGLLPRRLDHLFLRARDATGTAPVRIDDRYGSDHYPVMTWILFD
jgi:endonuclease/exonuclease/phosphatase family metal-dependent hydrolase